VAADLGERSPRKAQHLGLGRQLVERAGRIAAEAGHRELAVISAVGTRDYYRALGFRDRGLYQYRSLEEEASGSAESS
jgi:elongator complex protein 3